MCHLNRKQSAVRLELSFTANASASSVPTTAVSVQEPLKTWVGHLSLPSWTSQMCTVEYAEVRVVRGAGQPLVSLLKKKSKWNVF
jgi:hypothetical protein